MWINVDETKTFNKSSFSWRSHQMQLFCSIFLHLWPFSSNLAREMRLHMLQLLNYSFVDYKQKKKTKTIRKIQYNLCCFCLLFCSHFWINATRCDINRIYLHYFLVCLPEMKKRKGKNNSSIRMFGLLVLTMPMIYGHNEKCFEF